jgi:hypothetical protein
VEKKEILEKNPQVNKNLVADYERLEKELHRLGVRTKPEYRISPALGGSKLLLSNE